MTKKAMLSGNRRCRFKAVKKWRYIAYSWRSSQNSENTAVKHARVRHSAQYKTALGFWSAYLTASRAKLAKSFASTTLESVGWREWRRWACYRASKRKRFERAMRLTAHKTHFIYYNVLPVYLKHWRVSTAHRVHQERCLTRGIRHHTNVAMHAGYISCFEAFSCWETKHKGGLLDKQIMDKQNRNPKRSIQVSQMLTTCCLAPERLTLTHTLKSIPRAF